MPRWRVATASRGERSSTTTTKCSACRPPSTMRGCASAAAYRRRWGTLRATRNCDTNHAPCPTRRWMTRMPTRTQTMTERRVPTPRRNRRGRKRSTKQQRSRAWRMEQGCCRCTQMHRGHTTRSTAPAHTSCIRMCCQWAAQHGSPCVRPCSVFIVIN